MLITGKREIVEMMRQENYRGLAADHGFQIVGTNVRFVGGNALEVDGKLGRRHPGGGAGATGAIAGLVAALRGARMSPTEALRTVVARLSRRSV